MPTDQCILATRRLLRVTSVQCILRYSICTELRLHSPFGRMVSHTTQPPSSFPGLTLAAYTEVTRNPSQAGNDRHGGPKQDVLVASYTELVCHALNSTLIEIYRHGTVPSYLATIADFSLLTASSSSMCNARFSAYSSMSAFLVSVTANRW